MMFRGTKPPSPQGSERVNVETIGGRSSRMVLPQARLRDQTGKGAPFFFLCCVTKHRRFSRRYGLPSVRAVMQTTVEIALAWISGEPRHERHAAKTSAEELSQAPQPARRSQV